MEPVLTNGDMKRTSQGKSNQTRNMTLKPHLLQIKRVEFIPKCVTFKILQNCPSRSAAALSKLIFFGFTDKFTRLQGSREEQKSSTKVFCRSRINGQKFPHTFLDSVHWDLTERENVQRQRKNK